MKHIILAISLVLTSSFLLCGCGESKSFNISNKEDNTYIEIPAENNPPKTLSLEFEEAGFTEAIANDDESVTFVISKDDYKNFLKTLIDSVNVYMDDINNGYYDTITSISLDEDYTTFTVKVPSSNDDYENNLALRGLASKLLLYQAYAGEKECVTIKCYDNENNELIEKFTIKNQ